MYALEGFLLRLASSPHNSKFVVKGGVLLAAYELRRPAADVDFAGVRVSNVDVNVGDPIWPAPAVIHLPRLLEQEPIKRRGYPLEMVLAEKIVTALQRGAASTRWRDFCDIFQLTGRHTFLAKELPWCRWVMGELIGSPPDLVTNAACPIAASTSGCQACRN